MTTCPIELPLISPPIRQSNIKTALTCPRMFLFRERYGLVPGVYKSAPTIGTLLHAYMANRTCGADHEAVVGAITSHVLAYQEQLLGTLDQTGAVDRAAEVMRQLERDSAKAIAMGAFMWEKWSPELAHYDVVRLERDYNLTCPDASQHPLAGRLDAVLVKHNPKGIVIIDYKSCSGSPLDWYSVMEADPQVQLYRILASTDPELRVSGMPLLGFVHVVLEKPTCQLKLGQSLIEYLDECHDWWNSRDDEIGERDESGAPVCFKSGPRKGMPKPRWEWAKNAATFLARGCGPFKAFYTPYGGPLVSDEFRATLRYVEHLADAEPLLENFLRFGKSNGACRNHYGSRCGYAPLCDSDPASWPDLVRRLFRVRGADEIEIPVEL